MSRDTFLSSESDNHLSSFFVEQTDQNFLLFLNLLWEIHTYNSPQFSRISSRLDWKTLFVKLIRENFFSSNSGNHPSTFFRGSTKSNFLLFWNLLGGIHSSASPQSSRTSARLDWKTIFVKLSQDSFLSSESDNHLSTCFVEQPNQKFLSSPNQLGGIQSSASRQSSSKCPRLDWKTNFTKLSQDNFEHGIWQLPKCFFVEQPDRKFLLFCSLLGAIYSSTSPQFSRIRTRLDWKTGFMKLPRINFLSWKSDNHLSIFFHRTTGSTFSSLSELTRRVAILRQVSVQ